MALEKIISGGQTGVDRAALDAALAGDFHCSGWAPLGREAEDGIIPQHYPLDECGQSGTEERTRLNVRDSDATLILTKGADPAALVDGTGLTIEWAAKLSKPYLVVDLGQPADPDGVAEWLQGTGIWSSTSPAPAKAPLPAFTNPPSILSTP